MKRKIIALLTLGLSVSLFLGGCGGGSTNSKSITFSELFENDVIIYSASTSEGETFLGKDEKVRVYVCGADETYAVYPKANKLGVYAQMNDEEVLESISSEHEAETLGTYKLGIETDATGNNTETESILIQATYDDSGDYSKQPGWIGYQGFEIGSFVGHVTIYDSSYMMFQDSWNYSTIYYLIRDTKETKDKTICFDKVGTEGIVIDMDAEDAFK